MSDRNYIPPSGKTYEARLQGDGSLLVSQEGEKAGQKVAVDPKAETIDSETQRVFAGRGDTKRLFWVYRHGNKRVLSWPGGSLELEASDLTVSGGGGSGSLKPLKLTMPGKVLSVKVKEGDVVDAGQGLVIVEAMKMENLLLSPARAKVAKVHVKENDRLESGVVLISFAEAE
jgi:biotin carboxyl carrier protein